MDRATLMSPRHSLTVERVAAFQLLLMIWDRASKILSFLECSYINLHNCSPLTELQRGATHA